MLSTKKQIFFSHTWRSDTAGRDTHKRVYEIARNLRKYGWSTWVDEDDMHGNIDAAMASGIDDAEVVLVCLTEAYCKKVNDTAKDPRKRDNCLKEWTYANTRDKLMIPIVLEPCLLSISDWPPGVVSLYFGSTLYIDATQDDLENAVIAINKKLRTYQLSPMNDDVTNYARRLSIINKISSHINTSNRSSGRDSFSEDLTTDETGTDETSCEERLEPVILPNLPKRSRSFSNVAHRKPPILKTNSILI